MKIVSVLALILAAGIASTADAQSYRWGHDGRPAAVGIPESTPASPWKSSPSYRAGKSSGWARDPAQVDPDRAYRQLHRKWKEVTPDLYDNRSARSSDDRFGGVRKPHTWRPRLGAGSCTNPLIC